MSGRGGYQAPNHPAPVSGPGALSRRTDGGPADTQAHARIPDAAYGEQAQYQADQGAGPMQGATVLPFDRATERPSEPGTAGAQMGPGPGPLSAGIQPNDDMGDYTNLRHLVAGLQIVANLPGSNPSTRAFLRKLKSTGL